MYLDNDLFIIKNYIYIRVEYLVLIKNKFLVN